MRANGAAKAEPAAAAPVAQVSKPASTPSAVTPPPSDKAGEPPALPVAAPAADSPEAILAALKAEKDALENPPAEPDPDAPEPITDPVAAEIAKLKADIEALKAAKVAPPVPVEMPSADAPVYKTEREIEDRERTLYRIIDLAEDNPEGGTFRDADGKSVEISGEQLAKDARAAQRALRELPAARTALIAYQARQKADRAAYPTHFNGAHPDHKAVAALFAEYPAIAGNHALAARLIKGVAPKPAGKAVPPGTRAPAAPAARVAAPLADTAKQPELYDVRALGEGRGFGKYLRTKRL